MALDFDTPPRVLGHAIRLGPPLIQLPAHFLSHLFLQPEQRLHSLMSGPTDGFLILGHPLFRFTTVCGRCIKVPLNRPIPFLHPLEDGTEKKPVQQKQKDQQVEPLNPYARIGENHLPIVSIRAPLGAAPASGSGPDDLLDSHQSGHRRARHLIELQRNKPNRILKVWDENVF